MKHRIAGKLTLTVGALAMASATAIASETVTIRADSWYPMNGDPGADKPGYMIELAEAVFSKHGYDVEYRNMPWERALQSVRGGNHDCVVGAYESDAPDFLFPDESWGMDQSAFYAKPGGDWEYDGIESLSSVTVATIGGYAYGEALDEYRDNNPDRFEVLNANNALEQNIRKVAGGRVDVLLESPAVLEAQLQEMGMQGELVKVGELGDPVPMYIACSPANEERSKKLVNWVDEGTKALRDSGKLDEIMARYGLEDWK